MGLPPARPSTAGELLDARGLHAEPAQLRGCGGAGGGPLRGWWQ